MREETPNERTFRRVHDYNRVFTTPDGQRVLDDMRRSYRDTFLNDPYESAFRQGRRQVVLDIERLMEIANDPKFNSESIEEFLSNPTEE